MRWKMCTVLVGDGESGGWNSSAGMVTEGGPDDSGTIQLRLHLNQAVPSQNRERWTVDESVSRETSRSFRGELSGIRLDEGARDGPSAWIFSRGPSLDGALYGTNGM